MFITGNKHNDIANTTTALGIGATYTSAAFIVDQFRFVKGTLKTDQAGTLYIDQGGSAANWDNVDSFAIVAGTGFGFKLPIVAKYVRFRIINGGVAQTYLRAYFIVEP
jgi:hypothetical protein